MSRSGKNVVARVARVMRVAGTEQQDQGECNLLTPAPGPLPFATRGWSERREFTRVPMELDVDLDLGPRTRVTGNSRDLSLKGVFLRCAEKLPVGSTCQATLHFAGREQELRIEAQGKVARFEDTGLGIEFTQMNNESYGHLRNLLLFNARKPMNVEREFESHLGLRARSASGLR